MTTDVVSVPRVTPCLPEAAACFPPDPDVDLDGLIVELTAELQRLTAASRDDPQGSPVLLLGLALARRLAEGRIGPSALEQLVQRLTVDGFDDRATGLARLLGETKPADNAGRLAALFEGLARGEPGATPVPFEAFHARVEREAFGIVITAHPTFSLSSPLMRDLGAMATGHGADGAPLSAEQRAALIAHATRAEHRPDADLSLAREHALSVEAIANIEEALRRAYEILFEVAHRLYPDRWTELRPRLLTVATWVGYDLDGRSDIRWSDMLHKRFKVQAAQLERYLAAVRHLRRRVGTGGPLAHALRDTLELMESRIAMSAHQIGDEIPVFGSMVSDTAWRDRLRDISRRMYGNNGNSTLRLTEAEPLISMVDRSLARLAETPEIDPACSFEIARDLVVLRTELANHGLGLAHTHVRINATQVHNAIRKAVGVTADPNDPRHRQSYLNRISELLDSCEPVNINFASLLVERTSVKQLFMVVAQMLKYSDSSAPIRFLIAECESAFTVLTALYFAKMFGVEQNVDISPLFETEKALKGGSRVIDQLLENRHYRAYIEKRGRICVQTGYSDAGRYLGQTAAVASIERLRLRLIRVMSRHRLKNVELVIFDTHGESIGRGAHPAGLVQRLNYVNPPFTRAKLAEAGIAFKQEVSFQGGDGFLPFINPTGAFAVVTRLLEHALTPAPTRVDDPYYEESTYIREFFTTVKDFQVELMNDPNYGVLLSAFGANLLFKSGSRDSRRQHEDSSEIDHAKAGQIRAIPHNATLMQLGLLANSIGGLGAAISKDPEHFRNLYRRSERFRLILGIAEYGAAVSDARIMHGYITMHDPGFWIARAGARGDPEATSRRLRPVMRLADHLEPIGLHERQNKVLRKLQRDLTVLRDALDTLRAEGGIPPGCDLLVSDRTWAALNLLHAIRLALIQELFLLAMRVPDFSSRHDVTLKMLVNRMLHLDIAPVLTALEEIFPRTEPPASLEDFGEPADYRSDDSQSYQFENERIFQPMGGIYTLIRRISTAIAHRVGFFG
ncbi:MAG: phosphoenolpyruvate carboxylase [Rhodospirillaceae bacterium]